MRTGKEYLAALNDDRAVYVDGAKVNVTEHPAFTGISQTVAELYDYAADPDNDMTYLAPETGRLANKTFMTPRNRADLASRRQAISRWSELTNGFVGRSPDHVAAFFAGFASAPAMFDRDGRDLGANVTRFYKRILDESLFGSYVIIPPQVDRSTTAQGWDAEFIQVGVCEEREDGIVVRGSQMLGTGSAVSDFIFVSCIKPLRPGDEPYALSFAVPVGADGVRLYCRRPYAVDQPSGFDYPLSTRFDETDALVIFDDVFIPWEDVFGYRSVEVLREQFFSTGAHILGNTQAQIRLVTKMKFIIGVARKIAAMNKIDFLPPVQEKLGDLASLASIVEGMVIAAEETSATDDHGVEIPNRRFVYAPMGLQSEIYPRALALVRELVGGGVIQLPSSYHELLNDETRPDMERYIQSPGVSATERIKLFKLAWDIIGSEFAGRHMQYEIFYAGAPFVAKGYAYRNYGYDEPLRAVDKFLSSYELPEA